MTFTPEIVISGLNEIIVHPGTNKKDKERAQFLIGCAYGYEKYVDENYDPKAATNAQKRRARVKKLTNTLNFEEWKETLLHFNHTCVYCGKETEKLAQDHFVPVMGNGGYTKGNIVPACTSCNSSKSDRNFFDWYKKRKDCTAKSVYNILSFVRG